MSIRETFNRIRPPKLQNISHKVYCRFGSKQSFQAFHFEKQKPKKKEILRKTSESDYHSSLPEPVSPIKPPVRERDCLDISLESVQQAYYCIKCSKMLVEDEIKSGVCNECHKLQRYLGSGNFQKFVLFVLDFKTGKIPSYRSVCKLKRVGSIESILSFTLDKPDKPDKQESSLLRRPPLPPKIKASEKLSFSSQRMNTLNSGNFSKVLPHVVSI